MDQCNQCGAELGIGRFCTNCGHPVSEPATTDSWRTDTAERPRITVPPPAPSAPEPARYPLYADDPEPAAEEPTAFFAATDPLIDPEPPRHRGDEPPRTRGAGWVPWAAGFLVMLLIATAGMWLLFSGEDDETVLAQDTPSRSDRTPGRDRNPEPEPSPTEETSEVAGAPSELAPSVRVEAPAPAPPSEDSDGNTVDYVATNMLDGQEETTWRMPGDGTGETITFRLDSPAALTEVGLVNGYAKVGEDSRGLLDWYAGNRRIFEVEWSFEDGTVVTQSLTETTDLQTISLDDVETGTVTLRLLDVSDPGTGRASRDYTAISEISLVGAPATS